ncbi:MAG: M50 family metallopeptidase [Kineosporiaceae bacterium]
MTPDLQPGDWPPLVALVIALLAVAVRPVWRWARVVVTMAHEGGHAVAAVATGRRLAGITLHTDTSGLTVSRGPARGPGMVLTAFAGYVAPSLLGVLGAVAVAAGWAGWLLWVATGLLLLMLVAVRNVVGVLAVVATGGLLAGVSVAGSAEVRLLAVQVLVWFLLLGGVHAVRELARSRRRRGAVTSDADQLAALTGLPALLWVALFALVTLGCLALGGWILVAPLF